ncbi:MAG: PEGA domain-containing protein [Planctomycetota bacterium]
MFLPVLVLAGLATAAAVGVVHLRPGPSAPPSVAIQSQPPGATVFVDGAYLGVTPLQAAALARGEHSLKLVRHGFQTHRTAFEVGRSGETALDIRLLPEKRYSLTVTSDPPGATVSLDGMPTGLRTPATLTNLRAGKYELLLTEDGHLPLQHQAEVGESHAREAHVVLPSRMETYYQEAIRTRPDVITNYTELAHHYVIANQFEKAGSILKQGLELACRPTVDRRQIGRLHEEIQKIYYGGFDFGGEEAIEKVRPVLERVLQELTDSCPAALMPYQLLATMYSATGKAQEAAKVLEKGVKNVPDNPALLFLYAQTLYRLGDFERAVAPLERLVQLHDQNAPARHMLAEIYSRTGRAEMALRHREKIAEMMKRNPRAATGALVNLAAMHQRNGDHAEAAKKWEQAAALQTEPRMKAYFQMSAANEHAEAGRRDRAIGLLKEVLKAAPDDELKEKAQERLQQIQEEKK